MHRLKTLSVLFLEDNEVYAKNTIDFLKIYFARVIHTTNIKDALAGFEAETIDVIFSDIKVEDGNGLEFVQQVRNSNKEIPIVVMSAYKDEAFLLQAIPLGILSYELKPIDYDSFLLLLKKIAGHFEALCFFQISPNLVYNSQNKELLLDQKAIVLTKKEILFIELLLQYPKQVVPNHLIQSEVWEQEIMSDAALKNLVFRLRKKVGQEFIQTMHGVGYKLISTSLF